MKPVPISILAAACLLALQSLGASAADDRQLLDLPDEVRESFLGEMRGHLGNLDDILIALAQGDFDEAAVIAETRMDFGHDMWGTMAHQGMSGDMVAGMRELFKSMSIEEQVAMERSMGMGMSGYMPEDFMSLGLRFHAAAGGFAETARSIGDTPTVNDYARLMDSLGEITSVCRGCHELFRVN